MTRTVLVIPAGRYQVDAVLAARRLGHRVVTADNRPDNPAHQLADAAHDVSTVEVDGLLALARAERVDAVVSPGSDLAMTAAATIAESLGLSGPRPDVVPQLCSKLGFRELQERLGLPTPRWRRVNCDTDLAFPGVPRFVLKPDDSSGSKGCRIVAADDLEVALPSALAHSRTGSAVLEEYLEGRQCTLEGFLSGGRIVFAALTHRLTAEPPFVATHGHIFPAGLPADVERLAREQVEALFAAVGHRDGPFDCDLVATPSGPVLLELSPRIGGNHVSRLVRISTGVDLHEAAIRTALGESVRPTPTRNQPGAVALLGSTEPGRLAFDESERDRLASCDWVEELELHARPGDAVDRFDNGRACIGHALVTGRSPDEVAHRVHEVRRRLAVRAQVAASPASSAATVVH